LQEDEGGAVVLRLNCPYCGVVADESELTPGGAAHLRREGPGSDDAAFEAYLFLRDNPKGPHLERWRHAYGCGKWFIAARDTVTMQVFGTYPAQGSGPPPDIAARMGGGA
jgi:sarcosine oxidase subunit delta